MKRINWVKKITYFSYSLYFRMFMVVIVSSLVVVLTSGFEGTYFYYLRLLIVFFPIAIRVKRVSNRFKYYGIFSLFQPLLLLSETFMGLFVLINYNHIQIAFSVLGVYVVASMLTVIWLMTVMKEEGLRIYEVAMKEQRISERKYDRYLKKKEESGILEIRDSVRTFKGLDYKEHIRNKIIEVLKTYNDEDIYAISFYVVIDEVVENYPQLRLSYNTNECAGNSMMYNELRWNYNYWLKNETKVIDISDKEEMLKLQYYLTKLGVEDIGFEDIREAYDFSGKYIGKGPNGMFEFITLLKEIVIDLRDKGIINELFGEDLPIMIHDDQLPWFVIDATIEANNEESIKYYKDFYGY